MNQNFSYTHKFMKKNKNELKTNIQFKKLDAKKYNKANKINKKAKIKYKGKNK